MSPILQDALGRQITYLRLSVTDRCQFRCVYCVPHEGLKKNSQSNLSPDEMERLVRAVAAMGVWRLRLTGGEPLIRPDLLSLVGRFSAIPGITDLALTTNGERLADMAGDLKEAGLTRINISLDSLNPRRFHEITKSDSFFKVWSGVMRSLAAGLKVKLNVVALAGITDDEIDSFAALAFQHNLEVRFIEYMPLCGSAWNPDLVVPIEKIRSRIASRYDLAPEERGSEVAQSYALAGGLGRVGFIGSMTEPFCSKCSRLRVSAAGKIQLCLFSDLQYDLAPVIRSMPDVELIQETLKQLVLRKPAGHTYSGKAAQRPEPAHGLMQAIGG